MASSPGITECETAVICHVLDASFDARERPQGEPPQSKQRISPEESSYSPSPSSARGSGGFATSPTHGRRAPPPSLSVGADICDDETSTRSDSFRLLEEDFLDQLIVSCVLKVHEYAQLGNPRQEVVSYLLESYARMEELRNFVPVRVEMKMKKAGMTRDQLEQVAKKIREVIVSYCALAIADPDFAASEDEDPGKASEKACEVLADSLRGLNGKSTPPAVSQKGPLFPLSL